MKKLIPFTKMHGAGNDYIYVDTIHQELSNPELLSQRWSACHTGIGSDGLVLIGSSKVADFSMRIFNADGSEAMMCGNASRCIGKYLFDNGLTQATTIKLETLSGIKILKLHLGEDGKVEAVTVDMGFPSVQGEVDVEAAGKCFRGVKVSMGNPHLVIFVDDIKEIDLPTVGPIIEHDPLFPDRTNVEFAQMTAPDTIRMRVWERGSGITQACGTGACATAVAAATTGRASKTSIICMDGGTLRIEWDDENHIQMTGPATKVFDGMIETEL